MYLRHLCPPRLVVLELTLTTNRVGRMVVVHRPAQVVAVTGRGTIVRLAMADGIRTPRKVLTRHAATRRFLPLRLSRQSVAARIPITVRCTAACLVSGARNRIARRQILLLAACITPFHHRIPRDRMHRVIRPFRGIGAISHRQIGITMIQAPGPHRIPQLLGHLVFPHVKRTHLHRMHR